MFPIIGFGQDLKQHKEVIYFFLKKGTYSKTVLERPVLIKTRRLVKTISFSVKCACKKGGYLDFFWHNNPETDVHMPDVQTLTKKEISSFKMLTLDELVILMKRYDADFDERFNLYFIEKGEKYVLYPVKKASMFGDDTVDSFWLE